MKKKPQEGRPIEELLANQKITDIEMGKEVQTAFIQYSMSVITSRALPDVRDGLKPVHRRILYAMYEDHLTHDKPFRKSATTVGNVLGRYHPHGDTAVYDAMVRLAQWFSLRYPLVEGHGNFGSLDGDGAAAYRYTEARMARIADYMLADIKKDVVDMVPNFDNKLVEPTVLPSRFPNLLVNGSMGIAVGLATNIPPHNLGEVVEAASALLDNPEISIQELMEHIKGPDFPTGGIIYGTNALWQAYTTGRGKLTVRSRTEIDEEHNRILVTEIPYGVNKSNLVIQMAECAKDKRIEGISDIRDVSGRDGIKIIIDVRRDTEPQIVLNKLFKFTQLQDTFGVNNVALVNGEPKTLNIKEMLWHYVVHQMDVVTRKIKFELAETERKAHIFEGYKIATTHIEEVIEIIKKSASIPDAKERLMSRFGLSEIQAQAIVEMTLGRLSGLERDKIAQTLADLLSQIEEYKAILSDENRIKAIVKEDMSAIAEKFGDERRTEITESSEEITLEDLIERHTCLITMSYTGYVKRLPADTYSAQNRGGKGIRGQSLKDEDFVTHMLAVDSHSNLMMFTNTGRVYTKKAYQIPEASRTAKGTAMVNVIDLQPDEKITAFISIPEFTHGEYLTMVTRFGVIKRVDLAEFEYQRKGGKKAISLDEGDELLYVNHTAGDEEILLATHGGMAVRFEEALVRPTGRTSRGVRAIKLADDDFVVGVIKVEEGKDLLTITHNGFGKRSPFGDFSAHNRGTKGVCCQKITEKTGLLCSIAAVNDDNDIMLITNDGQLIRTHVSQIPTHSRATSGVIIMRTGDRFITNFTVTDRESEDEREEENEEAEE